MYNIHQHRTLHEAQSLDNIPHSFRSNGGVGENRRGRGGSRNNDEICHIHGSSRAKCACLMEPQPFSTSPMKSSMVWHSRAEDSIKRCRSSSLARYANRYHQHAKDGFVYWPMDSVYKKPKIEEMSDYSPITLVNVKRNETGRFSYKL
ncbi:unnamed protein product [Rotaria sordida]|uniref:Uncharacterized protein n=1 Tax=Rotaria sordida TaxID=392033 RepID=A0A814ZLS5_9BILA|nr:unnamed protein product [Rotaria sordida]CAF1526530.1 unnamed protein product [Rotaria sordida]